MAASYGFPILTIVVYGMEPVRAVLFRQIDKAARAEESGLSSETGIAD
jgi:hypothetical protein